MPDIAEQMAKRRPTFKTEAELKAFPFCIKGQKSYNVNDSVISGLYVRIGRLTKTFKLDFTFNGKGKTLVLGQFKTQLTLAQGRARAKEALAMLATGKDPALEKQLNKQAAREAEKQAEIDRIAKIQTFSKTYHEWFAVSSIGKRKNTIVAYASVTKTHLLPKIGDMPIVEIETKDIAAIINSLTGSIATKTKIKVALRGTFNYAIASGFISKNPLEGLEALVTKSKVEPKKMPAIVDPIEVADMLQQIDTWVETDIRHSIYVRLAIKLFTYLPFRSNELLGLTWDEIDLENAKINIPKDRMKTKQPFTAYLSTQAQEIFGQLLKLKQSQFVFCSYTGKHIYRESVLKAFREIGIDPEKHCLHGFRSTFSSLCNEAHAPFELVELSLSHQIGTAVSRVYDRSSLEQPRRRLMQWYSDLIDSLRNGNGTIELNVNGLYAKD